MAMRMQSTPKSALFHCALFAASLLAPVSGLQAEERLPITAPPPPPPLQSGEPLEPQVTIRRTEREVIYEYRRNGELFLVRVQPRVGPPYYFIDVDNNGTLDYRPGDPIRNNINQWTLFRW
jgi:hypothetical protein